MNDAVRRARLADDRYDLALLAGKFAAFAGSSPW
jgi:hypothetical protein